MRLRNAVAALLVAAAAATALSQDKAPAAKPDWERVLEAFRAKDDAAVAAVAAATKLDPWLVADALCERKEFDAAAAFARTVKRKDCVKLAAYVASQKTAPVDEKIRKAYAAADAALTKRDAATALAAGESVSKRGADVPSLRLAYAYAFALRATKRYDEALDVLSTAAETAVSLGWLRQAWVFASEEVGVHTRKGDPMVAAIASKLAVEAAEKLDDKSALATACMDAGNAHLAAQMLPQALALEQRALALHTELGDRGKAAGDQINIGIILMRGGRDADALPALEKGLAAAKAAGERTYAATATGAIGLIWMLRKDHEKAAKWLADARKAKEEIGDVRGAAGESMNLGNVRSEQGRFDEARAAIEQSLATFEKLGWQGDAVTALRALGRVATAQKKPADAVAYLERAMAILAPTKTINTIVPVRVELAQAYEAAGNRNAAEENYRECVPWVEVLGDAEDLKTVKDAFARLGMKWDETPSLGGGGGDDDASAAATESARTRWKSAQASLAKGEKARAMGDLREAAELLAKHGWDQAAARRELDGVYREGVRLGVEVNDPATVYHFVSLRRGCACAQAVYERSPSHAGAGRSGSIARIQDWIAAGTTCVAYAVFDDETFALVVGPKAKRVVKLGPTKAIAAAARIALTDAAVDPEPALAALRALVVTPLALDATTVRVVVSAPDAPLAGVPAALLFPDRDVACLPTPEVVWAAGPARTPGESAFVLGTDAEAKAWRGTRVDPAVATWDALTSALPADGSCRMVVLTSKTLPDPDDTGYRALDFAPTAGRRVVDGETIGGTEFPAHLVVLASGDAGHLEDEPGEGPGGLPFAFLSAGVRGVVASLWEPDAAAGRAFVDKLTAAYVPGTTMAAAVRAAQASVRSRPQWKHPRFWAGWVLTGLPE